MLSLLCERGSVRFTIVMKRDRRSARLTVGCPAIPYGVYWRRSGRGFQGHFGGKVSAGFHPPGSLSLRLRAYFS